MKIGSYSRAFNQMKRKRGSSKKNLALFGNSLGSSPKGAQQNEMEMAVVIGGETPKSKIKLMHHHESFKVSHPKMFPNLQQLNVPVQDTNRFQKDLKKMLMIEENTPSSSKSSNNRQQRKKKGVSKRSAQSKHNKNELKELDYSPITPKEEEKVQSSNSRRTPVYSSENDSKPSMYTLNLPTEGNKQRKKLSESKNLTVTHPKYS